MFVIYLLKKQQQKTTKKKTRQIHWLLACRHQASFAESDVREEYN